MAVVAAVSGLQREQLGPPGAVPWVNPQPPLGGPHLPPLQHHWNQSAKAKEMLKYGSQQNGSKIHS